MMLILYIGLYVDAPCSKITCIGIVDDIVRDENYAEFYIKALIKLKIPKVRGFENMITGICQILG